MSKVVNLCIKCGEKTEDPEALWCDSCFSDDYIENMLKYYRPKVQQKSEPIVEDSHFDWWGADSL